jgi:hypothetical protein
VHGGRSRGFRGPLGVLLVAGLALGFAPAVTGTAGPDAATDLAASLQPLPTQQGDLRGGAAVVDVSWHVGASQGQYAGEGPGPIDQPTGGVDPSLHSTTSRPTRGVESRNTARALVLDDGERRWALVTNDLYIPQDLLTRRVAGILAEHDLRNPARAVGITADDLTVTVTHSHSSPFYSSTAWGVWAFQDVFDLRFFEFVAQGMADAVIAAASDLRPVRAGVATTPVTIAKRNPEGPTISAEDEPLPAAWPMTEVDATLALLRVDDLTVPDAPTPLAHWVVFGRHPEGMKDNGLHTGEYVGALLRILDREEGGVALFSQNDVGTSEISRDAKVHVPAARQEYDSNSHAMLERVARDLADAVQDASRDLDARWSDPSAPLVAAEEVVLVGADAQVAVATERVAPPGYRPFPTVSNCRTEEAASGNPQAPIVGLPDCSGPGRGPAGALPFDPGVTYDTLREAGVPVPDNYGGPSYTGLQETLTATLQAVRIGDVAFTICPCEQFTDQSRNIRSRLDREPGNLWFGWDWTANHRFHTDFRPGVAYVGDLLPDDVLGEGVERGPVQLDLDPDTPGEQWWCEPDDRDAPSTWTCKDPRVMADRDDPRTFPSWDEWPTLAPVSHGAFLRWKARIYNDAAGWDEYVGQDGSIPALEAEAEPLDPAAVWGNWTHEELTEWGYGLVVPVSMANDYWGYIPTYREFQARDYYRKALAGLGPHGADFLATRLTRMAAELNGAPDELFSPTAKDIAYAAEEDAAQTAKQALVGAIAAAYLPLYEAGLPADGGTPGAVVTEPAAVVERPGVASFRWVGGSNYVDVPHARVERRAPDGTWRPFGDGYGEVQVVVDLPTPAELPAYAAGTFPWVWTATFEAHVADVERTFADGVRRDAVPPGTYRFVVDGCHRGATPAGPGATGAGCSAWDALGRVRAYEAVSAPFEVVPWQGVTVDDLDHDAGAGLVSVTIGPRPAQDPELLGTQLTTFESGVGRLGMAPLVLTTGVFDHALHDAVALPRTAGAHPTLYVTGPTATDLRDYGAGESELFCFRCAFEPWADTARVASVTFTVIRADGTSETLPGRFDPHTRRWSVAVALGAGDTVAVEPGGVRTQQGDTNGTGASLTVAPGGG